MRRLALAALALATAAPFPALAFDAADPAARVQPLLAAQLTAAAADATLPVFVHGTDVDAATAAIDAAGLRLARTFDKIGVAVATGTPAQIRAAGEQPGVTYLEGDQPIDYHLSTSHVATRGQQARETFTDAAGRPIDGSGVSVAVVDSGVDGTHPFFRLPDGSSSVVRNVKDFCPALNTGEGGAVTVSDCVRDVPGNDSDSPSGGGHGTHVAGIVGGQDVTTSDGQQLHGAAPGARIVAVSAGAATSVYGGTTGMYWVLENHAAPCGEGVAADVCPPIRAVNNSWGISGGGEFAEDDAITKTQRALAEAGVVTVWSAGNSGGDGAPGTTQKTSVWGQDPTPGILMVGNYNDGDTGTRDGEMSSSSSRGERGDPLSYPDLSAPGTMITSSCRPYLPVCSTGGDPVDAGNYNTISGTSMAAPHIAGIVAQLVQADPSLRPGAIEDALEDTAYKFTAGGAYESDPSNPDDTTSYDKGHGLVDVLAAVGRVLGQPVDGGTPPPVMTSTSCDGQAVVTDAAGDAKHPVTGSGEGTDAADVLDVSMSTTATDVVVNATVTSFSPVPVPGTTMTSYYVAWTAPNGKTYGVRYNAPGGAFSFGEFDTTANSLRTGTTTTVPGSASIAAPGIISWSVPRALLGDPTIPVAPGAAAAVTDPYAVVIGGIGVLGGGVVLTQPLDRAPDMRAGSTWSVCGSPEPDPTETAEPTATAEPTQTPTPTPTPTASCKGNSGKGKGGKCKDA